MGGGSCSECGIPTHPLDTVAQDRLFECEGDDATEVLIRLKRMAESAAEKANKAADKAARAVEERDEALKVLTAFYRLIAGHEAQGEEDGTD